MAQSSVDSDRLSSAGISTHSSGTAGTVGGSVVGVRVGEQGLKRDDEDEYNLGPLPPMWEKAFTPSGEVYFIDHTSGTSHWLDPRLARVRKHSLGECGEDELPFGWERVTDERYGSYYVDHINRRTQYENPVLQARRLRAEKLSNENGGATTPNGQPPPGELRGERFSLTLTKGTQGLGFTLIGAEGVPEMEGYLQIRSIVPHSPAWMDGGVRAGDVVVGVGSRGVRGMSHAQVAALFTSLPANHDVTLHLVRGYPLPFDSADPNTRVLSTRAVAAPPAPPAHPAPPAALHHLTTALRTRFNLDSPNPELSRDETDTPTHNNQARCASADQLMSNTESRSESMCESGRELVVALRRGNAGFGFTIADSVHGQKVKKVLDRSRCAGLREGDVLLQIGDVDVSHAPHQTVVQVLKECPALHESSVRVWRRAAPAAAAAALPAAPAPGAAPAPAPARAPRSRSATRPPPPPHAANNNNTSRSKTPTADQLRGVSVHDPLDNNVEATYAVPEQKRSRESLLERRRRSSTPGGRLTLPPHNPHNPHASHAQPWTDWPQPWPANDWNKWQDQNSNHWEPNDTRWGSGWGSAETPTVHVDLAAGYWRGNTSQADSSDNGFPEDGLLHSPSSAGMPHNNNNDRMRTHSPSNSTERVRSNSPCSTATTDRLLDAHSPNNNNNNNKGSPNRVRESSPSAHSPPMATYDAHNNNYQHNYTQAGGAGEGGGGGGGGEVEDPLADVVVRLGRGAAGFGFRIVGGTEDGSRLAVGHVVHGGPADGLLRPGDLLTSVDGVPLLGATHARAVAAVCQAAARGHVSLGVRHNRADVHAHHHHQQHHHHHQLQQLQQLHQHHRHPHNPDPSLHHLPQTSYSILHPAPMYPQQNNQNMYGVQYNNEWSPDTYDVTLTRNEGEGFGFVVISSTNKATSTIGQVIGGSPAARSGRLQVGDALLAINQQPIRNLAHPEVVALIKRSGAALVLTLAHAPR